MRLQARSFRVVASALLLPALLAISVTRCGKDQSDKQGDDDASDSGSALIPADWDGVADYAASIFTVVDE